MLKSPFRQLVWTETAFVASLLLLLFADRSTKIAGLFHPDSELGAGILLILLGFAVVSVFALLVFVPWACASIYMKPNERLYLHMSLTIAGVIEVALLSLWLFNVFILRK